MKNASHILASLRQRPSFIKLARQACIARVRGLFPPHLQRLVRYGYFKDDTLYFVLAHPGAKQEFDNIIASIKAPLRQYTPPECRQIVLKEIRAFVSHHPCTPEDVLPRDTEVLYDERASGAFENTLTHPELHRIMDRIMERLHARAAAKPT